MERKLKSPQHVVWVTLEDELRRTNGWPMIPDGVSRDIRNFKNT
jgi:hypothetical protein